MTGQNGTLKTWNDDKGFGFIRPEDGSADVFVHILDFKDRGKRPAAGDALAYQLIQDGNGRIRACNVVTQVNFGNPAPTHTNSCEPWQIGTLRRWDDKKGFGFIQPRAGGGDVFIHIKDFKHGDYRPLASGAIHYRLKIDDNGKPKAYDAIMAHEGFKIAKKKPAFTIWLLISLPFLLSLSAFYISHSLLTLLAFLAYLVMSFSAVVAYAQDKKQAKTGTWRTSESFLHWIELFGGWPGALYAQREIRHKNNKSSYQAIFRTIVVLHIGVWVYYLFADSLGVDFQSFMPGGADKPKWLG